MTIDLDDARQLLERAKRQIQEFKELIGRQSPAPLWTIERRHDETDGYTYSVRVNRATLREMKPAMADAANNLVHSLDHVAAACARLENTWRSKQLFFPISDDDAEFTKLQKKVRPRVGDAYMNLIARLRTQSRQPYHPSRYSYLALMREMAGGNKHWNLALAHSHAHAVAWTLPGDRQQTLVNIPGGHFEASDEFEFLKTTEPAPAEMGFSIALALSLEGFASFPSAGLDSAFDVAARLVEEVIEEVERLAAATP